MSCSAERYLRTRWDVTGFVFRSLLSDPRASNEFDVTRIILRKEVIQPQVPLRLPCYDFTPVAELTVVRCPLERLAHGLRVNPTPMV